MRLLCCSAWGGEPACLAKDGDMSQELREGCFEADGWLVDKIDGYVVMSVTTMKDCVSL